jgi:PAS domain S-box-containing protein
MAPAADLQPRVLILAPTGRDAAAAAEQLSAAGLHVNVSSSVIDLIARLNEGAGAAVIAEEALRLGLKELADWVAGQPPWSDFPFVVLTSRLIHPKEDTVRARLLGSLGNVSLMERPLSSVSLTSAVKAGLRARKRQLETQSMLEHLRASEERLRLFVEHAPAALVMLDRDLRYLAVSRRWMKDFGLSESIVGRSHYEVFPEIPAEWRESHRRALGGETEVSTDDHLQLADGRSFWLKRDVRPWRDNQGRIGGLVVSWEDITGRKQAEEQQHILMREVMHRTKNLIAVIQSIATATFRKSDDPSQEVFRSRLNALANAHGLVLNAAGEGALLDDIVRGQLAGFGGAVSIDGPRLFLKPSAAQSFALVIHELATNAAKHGALTSNSGRVAVSWSLRSTGGTAKLHFRWQERGGPRVEEPTRKGFGTVLLEHAIAGIDSEPTIDFDPAGLTYETDTALSMLMPAGNRSPILGAAQSSAQLEAPPSRS